MSSRENERFGGMEVRQARHDGLGGRVGPLGVARGSQLSEWKLDVLARGWNRSKTKRGRRKNIWRESLS